MNEVEAKIQALLHEIEPLKHVSAAEFYEFIISVLRQEDTKIA